MNAAPEHRAISPAPPTRPRAEPEEPERTSSSRFTKPKVLMGEVVMPRNVQIAEQREAFRAFMMAKRRSPTGWARAAGISASEVLGFLAGTTRNISPASLQKLAAAAGCAVEDFFR